MLTWRVGRSTVFQNFRPTIASINNVLHIPGIPFSNKESLYLLAEGFSSSMLRASPPHGSVAALDGISIKIDNPPD